MTSAVTSAVTDSGSIVVAHSGLGNNPDLPIPFELVVLGSVLALAASFTVLAVAWRRPRYDGPTPGTTRMAPWRPDLVRRVAVVTDHPATTVVTRLLGVAFFAYLFFALVAGPNFTINPGLGMFYVLLWVGIVPASLLFGRFYRAFSPVRAINAVLARVAGTDPEHGMRDLPSWVGYWPAAVGLYAFVWLELVSVSSVETGSVRLWLAAYFAIMLIGGAVFGNRFYEHADPFEVYSTLVGHLSIWGRDDRGTLLVRSPLANLSTIVPVPGLAAVVAVLFGSTAFDSFRESLPFIRFVQDTTIDSDLILNVTLLGLVVLVGLLLAAASAATGSDAGIPRIRMPAQMGHSIVPIIVGYIGAHYLTYLFEYGQQVVIYMSDPLANGSNLLGTADLQASYFLTDNVGLLAFLQVGGVVVGHIVAAVASHDRSLALLPKKHQLTGQLPMLGLMIALTAGGLYLLFAS